MSSLGNIALIQSKLGRRSRRGNLPRLCRPIFPRHKDTTISAYTLRFIHRLKKPRSNCNVARRNRLYFLIIEGKAIEKEQYDRLVRLYFLSIIDYKKHSEPRLSTFPRTRHIPFLPQTLSPLQQRLTRFLRQLKLDLRFVALHAHLDHELL